MALLSEQREAYLRNGPQAKCSETPLGRLSHQKLMTLPPQRCEGRAGVGDVRPREHTHTHTHRKKREEPEGVQEPKEEDT